ncbi:MAG: sodium:calcium antiporter [Acidimicrobiales bacterium]|nr:sodium:calcium antiporter [Acidimicrobiales bacterium]
MADVGWVALALVGVAGIVWGAEVFAEHLGDAAAALRVSTFALALLLAGAEPEELATGIAASLRHAPAIAFGDVIGANVAMCLVALGVGASFAPLPFGHRVRLYGLLGLPVGAVCAWVAWDGRVGRPAGFLLVVLYVIYVAVIWRVEGRPPALGETGEIEEAQQRKATDNQGRRRIGKDLVLIVGGVIAMSIGATVLVEGIRHLASADAAQTKLSLTLVGFATAFELVVLAVSASRRGASEAVVAAVVGSFAYNATMTLGAAALARPLLITNPSQLHVPLLFMLAALALATGIGSIRGHIGRTGGLVLLACYPVFILLVLTQP